MPSATSSGSDPDARRCHAEALPRGQAKSGESVGITFDITPMGPGETPEAAIARVHDGTGWNPPSGWADPVIERLLSLYPYQREDTRSWRTGDNVAIPDHATAIAAWSNDDDYGFPGGDRTYCLYRFDDLYVSYDDGTLDLFGRFDTQDEAVKEWIDHYLTDEIRPLEDIVDRFSAGPSHGCSDDEVNAAVTEAVDGLPLGPVCELGGKSLGVKPYSSRIGSGHASSSAASGPSNSASSLVSRIGPPAGSISGRAMASPLWNCAHASLRRTRPSASM